MSKRMISSVIFVLALLSGCGHADSTAGNPPDNNPAKDAAGQALLHQATFSVPDMSCPMCPITVRKALENVDGVAEAEASLDDKQARVVFDPARTSVEALIAAVAETGFTATLSGEFDE